MKRTAALLGLPALLAIAALSGSTLAGQERRSRQSLRERVAVLEEAMDDLEEPASLGEQIRLWGSPVALLALALSGWSILRERRTASRRPSI